MQDNTNYTISRFANSTIENEGRRAIRQTGLEHLVLKDFFRDSALDILDGVEAYSGIISIAKDELTEEFIVEGDSIEGIINSGIDLLKTKPKRPALTDYRRKIILKLETATINMISNEDEKSSEYQENRYIADVFKQILECFDMEDASLTLSALIQLKTLIELN